MIDEVNDMFEGERMKYIGNRINEQWRYKGKLSKIVFLSNGWGSFEFRIYENVFQLYIDDRFCYSIKNIEEAEKRLNSYNYAIAIGAPWGSIENDKDIVLAKELIEDFLKNKYVNIIKIIAKHLKTEGDC